MHAKNQTKLTLTQPEHIEYVSRLITSNQYPNIKELAKAVSQNFVFLIYRVNSIQDASRLYGSWKLPATLSYQQVRCRLGSLPRSVSMLLFCLLVELPHQVDQVRGMKMVLVDTNEKMSIWNEMMISEHYLGTGPFVGRQLRYLIDSEQGLLGRLGVCRTGPAFG